ncbi:hypothetical protein ACVK00_006722 [Burkholderia sp. PvR073]|uniref:hypothetical protein n=1 Tax=Burkholderia ambifaria TaxID=152480 RepID=UPI00348AECF5
MRASFNAANEARTIVNRFTSKTKPSLIRGNIVSVRLNIARICRAAFGGNVITCGEAAAIRIIISAANALRCARVVSGANSPDASAGRPARNAPSARSGACRAQSACVARRFYR